MSQEFKDLHGLKAEHLYIQPFVYDVKKPDDVIVFVSTNNTPAGKWFTNLIYHKDEGLWYQGPSISINSAGGGTWEGVKAEIEKNGWTSLK